METRASGDEMVGIVAPIKGPPARWLEVIFADSLLTILHKYLYLLQILTKLLDRFLPQYWRPHSGQSSQLLFDAHSRSAQFLPNLAAQ